jgi:DNA-binding transcriptional LysR family regulator
MLPSTTPRSEEDVQLQHVRYFLTLVQTFNFTRAAEQCNVTQPALTKALRKLEHELGGDLIHRERRLTQLTDLGKLVLPMLQRTVAAADAACKQAKRFRSEQVAPLHIGLPPSISAFLMVEPLSKLMCCIEGLQVHFVENDSRRLIDALFEGRIHSALLGVTDDLPERLDHWRLFEESYRVAVAPGHPLARFEAVPIAALQQTVWLEREECEAHGVLERVCFGGNGPRVAHRGRHEDHLQHMAAAGLGALLVPEHMPCLSSVLSRPIEGDPVSRSVELVVVAGRRYSPALHAFIKIVRRHDWQRVTRKATTASAAAVASRWAEESGVASNSCHLRRPSSSGHPATSNARGGLSPSARPRSPDPGRSGSPLFDHRRPPAATSTANGNSPSYLSLLPSGQTTQRTR